MRIELRKKYPYYGKYKFKVSIYNNKWCNGYSPSRIIEEQKQNEVKNFLNTNWRSALDFKWACAWNVYLRDETVFDDINKVFPTHISTVYRPAPGYEDLIGKGVVDERVLWYDKFPYKIVAKIDSRTDYTHTKWCNDNMSGDFKTSSGSCDTSFYFMNSFDAMAFKLAFSDNVKSTYVADKVKTEKLLKERIDDAQREYNEYLEGENDKTGQ